MPSGRITILAAATLLVMALALLIARGHFLSQRSACHDQLRHMATILDAYAREHGGRLPADANAINHLLGPAADAYRVAPAPGAWKRGEPQPYLSDHAPHPYVNGFHVLYTDGTVRMLDAVPPIVPPRR